MKLYLISQTENTGYDTYDSAVVAAENAKIAREINPDRSDGSYAWCHSKDVTARYLGVAKAGTKRGLICASFNAG